MKIISYCPNCDTNRDCELIEGDAYCPECGGTTHIDRKSVVIAEYLALPLLGRTRAAIREIASRNGLKMSTMKVYLRGEL